MKLRFRRLLLGSFIVIAGGTLTSCATILANKQAPITISVTPDSSTIILNGELKGYSPLQIMVDRRSPQLLEIRHPGYEPQKRILKTDINPVWVTADVLLTAGIGAVVDLGTGAWNTFTPEIIIMDLSKLD